MTRRAYVHSPSLHNRRSNRFGFWGSIPGLVPVGFLPPQSIPQQFSCTPSLRGLWDVYEQVKNHPRWPRACSSPSEQKRKRLIMFELNELHFSNSGLYRMNLDSGEVAFFAFNPKHKKLLLVFKCPHKAIQISSHSDYRRTPKWECLSTLPFICGQFIAYNE